MYPKDYFAKFKAKPEQGTCFVVMPFSRDFTPVFRIIQKSLEDDLGFKCTRTDELLGGGNIIEDILRGIASSELIVVDVTGRNPNVYYELGIAHMSKPVDKVVLLSRDIEAIPFDLRQYRHVVYARSPAGLRSLGKSLREAVASVSAPVHRILLDEHNTGLLPMKLMGGDHCLYEFRVRSAFAGFNAAKFNLEVTRHFMEDQPRSDIAYRGGMGLSMGERRQIGDLQWDIALERTPDKKSCFRIFGPTKSLPAKAKSRGGRVRTQPLV